MCKGQRGRLTYVAKQPMPQALAEDRGKLLVPIEWIALLKGVQSLPVESAVWQLPVMRALRMICSGRTSGTLCE